MRSRQWLTKAFQTDGPTAKEIKEPENVWKVWKWNPIFLKIATAKNDDSKKSSHSCVSVGEKTRRVNKFWASLFSGFGGAYLQYWRAIWLGRGKRRPRRWAATRRSDFPNGSQKVRRTISWGVPLAGRKIRTARIGGEIRTESSRTSWYRSLRFTRKV